MKKLSRNTAKLTAVFLGVSLIVPAAFADNPQEWRKAADNHILAQKLVNDALARHPEVVVLGLHATPPGSSQQQIIAINLDRIGKIDDDEAKAVTMDHKFILEPNLKDNDRFEVQLWMKDAAGRQLPVECAIVFKKSMAGSDEVVLLQKALAIREEMSKQLPSFSDLFRTVD